MTPTESAAAIIAAAIAEFRSSVAVVTSFQREGVVITDLVLNIAPGVRVLTIDTNRLPPTTHGMIERIEHRYRIHVERILPDPVEVEAMTSTHGRDLFRDGVPQRMLCCNIRKVRPLANSTSNLGAIFVGMRRQQGGERGAIDVVDRSTAPVKISPLADWSSDDVLRYTRERDLPEHPLYAHGYRSIGCDPCTRAATAGESERAGRWWWEGEAPKECGLHFSPDGTAERAVDVMLRDLLERTPAA